jgi:hypothetical protein
MSDSLPSETRHAALRAELATLPGVRHVGLEGPPWRVWLVCDADTARHTVELEARALLVRAGVPAGEVAIEVATLGVPEPRRRVRLVKCSYEISRPGQGVARVELEWAGAEYAREIAGESGPIADLRLVAQATLCAIGEVIRGALGLQLVGVKSVRIFDRDLVVVLLHAESAGGVQLAGASLVAGSVHRAACIAVLNATNRILGNYLTVGD